MKRFALSAAIAAAVAFSGSTTSAAQVALRCAKVQLVYLNEPVKLANAGDLLPPRLIAVGCKTRRGNFYWLSGPRGGPFKVEDLAFSTLHKPKP